MDVPNRQAIVRRIRTLIAREDQGDVTAAARRLHMSPGALCQLERMLADDAPRPPLDFLAEVTVAYGADACWVLTGLPTARLSELPAADVRRLVELLNAVSEYMIAERRGRSATPAASGPRRSMLGVETRIEAAEPLPIS